MQSLMTTRDVTVKECPWLDNDIKAGTVVWLYDGHVYGCISQTGTACVMKAAEAPFFELPTDSLKEIVG